MTFFSDHYTVNEAADKLGIHPNSLLRIVQRGDLPSVQQGRMKLIPRTELDEFAKTYDPGRKSPAAKLAYQREVAHAKRKATLGRNIRMLRGE